MINNFIKDFVSIKNNSNIQYGSFGGDGTKAFWVAPYDLNPMSSFDKKYLL